MKKLLITSSILLSVVTLTACSSKKGDDLKLAKSDANTVVNYVYKGNESGASDVLTSSLS